MPRTIGSTAGIVALLALSALALALAPTLMGPEYSWLTHTTSESAAQNTSGAWLARAGFLIFGLAVLWLVALVDWKRPVRWLHGAFGVLMVATAAFSHKPLTRGAEYDRFEDLLHSITASAMGFAFAAGVAVVAITARDRGRARRVLDLMALVASIAIPLAMVGWERHAGLLQRAMFLVAYLWYGLSATEARGETGPR